MILFTSVTILIPAIFCYWAYTRILGLRKNIKLAKETGLPYIITPWTPWWVFGQLTTKLWKPIFAAFPTSWTGDWLEILPANHDYDYNYKPFSRLGDTHILVSPQSIVIHTASAEAIHQISLRRDDFPKKIEVYGVLRIFGDNVVTTEGALWRMHRRVTAASFNERNTSMVFQEAIRQTQSMLDSWVSMGPDTTITSLEQDTMHLALHIISYVGFGLRLLWPGQKPPLNVESSRWTKYGTVDAAAGHSMTFIDSVSMLLECIYLILLAPHWLLRILPFQMTHKAMEAYDNYKQYMDELVEDKRQEIYSGEETEGMDLVGFLVGTTIDDESSRTKSVSSQRPLTKDEIIGNLFIMLIAGHETSADVIHFSLVELACRPSSQRRLQREIDAIVGETKPETWSVEEVANPLLSSMAGAVLYETMRSMPPVTNLPKGVSPPRGESHQILTIDGHEHAIPACVNISLVISAAHRNPRYWPHKASEITSCAHDLDDWVPERWFESLGKGVGQTDPSASTVHSNGGSSPSPNDIDEYSDGDIPAAPTGQLFRPEHGAYIPFSDGPRACLGRRIAQVEIMAALAVIFHTHSVELAVDEWATDDEVARMSREERAVLYAKAQAQCRATLLTASSKLTLKLHGSKVPVRAVPKGEERFVNWAV